MDLRSEMLADEPCEPVIVHHRGQQVELRPPTLAQQKSFNRLAKDKKSGELDGTRLLVLSIIGCTFRPGTDDSVFEMADEEALMQKSTDPRTIVGKLSRAMSKMLNAERAEIEKDFEVAPDDK